MKPYSRHQIEDLLDKFMAGKTTIEEESLLSQYFSSAHDVPAEWEDYKALFGYIDRGLEGDLLPESSSPSHRKWLWWVPAAAAAAIVAFVFAFKALNKPDTTQPISPPIIAQKVEPKDKLIDQEADNLVSENESADNNISAPNRAKTIANKQQPIKQKHSLAVTHHEAQTNLIAQNERLLQENERLQRELEELNQRAIIIDMEAMGYQAVKDENGSTIYVDMQQEIDNQFNNQSTNIPGL